MHLLNIPCKLAQHYYWHKLRSC